MSRSTNPQEPFEGFDSPNYTQVPDELFDQLMPDLSDAELRVLLYIVRRTFGFKKDSDDISLSQMVNGITTGDGRVLDRGTGLSKATVARGLTRLKEKGVIVAVHNRSAERGNEATTYRLRFKGDTVIPLVSAARQAPLSQQRDKPLSQQRDTQETVQQETDFDLSNFEGSDDDLETGGRNEGVLTSSDPGSAGAHELVAASRNGAPVPLGEILQLRAAAASSIGNTSVQPMDAPGEEARSRRSGRASGSSEEREQLRAFLEDFAVELGDEAPLRSTMTRTLTIFTAAGVPSEQWGEYLYQARGLTQEHTAQIRKIAGNGGAGMRRKNKMPYFLAALEQLVGVHPAFGTATPDPHELT